MCGPPGESGQDEAALADQEARCLDRGRDSIAEQECGVLMSVDHPAVGPNPGLEGLPGVGIAVHEDVIAQHMLVDTSGRKSEPLEHFSQMPVVVPEDEMHVRFVAAAEGLDDPVQFFLEDRQPSRGMNGVAQENPASGGVFATKQQKALECVVGDDGEQSAALSFHPEVTEVNIRDDQGAEFLDPQGSLGIGDHAGAERVSVDRWRVHPREGRGASRASD